MIERRLLGDEARPAVRVEHAQMADEGGKGRAISSRTDDHVRVDAFAILQDKPAVDAVIDVADDLNLSLLQRGDEAVVDAGRDAVPVEPAGRSLVVQRHPIFSQIT